MNSVPQDLGSKERDECVEREYLPLGIAQLSVWLDSQISDGRDYRLGGWARFEEQVDRHELEQSLRLLVARHDGLRVRVDPQQPRQWIEDGGEVPLRVVEHDTCDSEATLNAQIDALFAEPMPFGDHPLFRIVLLELQDCSYLIWCFHHIIVDAVSVRITIGHWLNAHQTIASSGTVALSPESSIVSTVMGDTAYLDSPDYARDLSHWTTRFDPLPPPLLENMTRTSSADVLACMAQGAITGLAHDAFAEAATAAGTSPQRALFALFVVALARRYDQTDIACGLALHRRNQNNLHAIGMMSGIMPIVLRFEDWWSLEDCVNAYSEQVDSDLRHHRLPVHELSRALGMSGNGQSLFDVSMSWIPGSDGDTKRAAVEQPALGTIYGREPVPIVLDATESTDEPGILFRILVNPDLAGTVVAEALRDLLSTTIEQFSAGEFVEYSTVAKASSPELARVQEFGTGPSLDRVVVLPARFAGLCRSFPCRVAVSECLADGVSGRSLSWGALEADARRLAVRLVATGVVPGTVVGVALGGVDLIVGLLGVWKAGGVYLPVDPEHPDERLGFVLGDAGAGLVVTAGPAAAGLAARLEGLGTEVLRLDDPVVAPAVGAEPAMDPAMDPGVATTAESAAYVIYTSGSTGRPKGVVVTHGQLAAFASAVVSDLDLDTGGQGDAVVLSAASPLFDAVFMDLSVWLGTGARLVRLDARSLAQPGYLADAVASHGASYMDLTPSVWRSALASGWTPGAGMRVVTGGEALEPDLAAALTAGGARLYNSYGPTEATVVAVAGDVGPVSEGGAIAIGGPLAGTRAYVLDSRLAPVPIGVPGELVLGGAQVARGYLGRPGLTAASFIADPFSGVPGARMYRTGDLVRWRTDGQLEFLGRIDGQVKIRGMRIEPGEIEATLAALDGVAQAAVTAPKDADGQARLVAYVVPAAVAPDERDAPGAPRTVPLEGDLAPTALRAALGRVLPEHMVPQAYLGLARMPLTPTGKTDRKALPEAGAETARAAFAPPETETETRIAAAIEELLGLEQVGRHDSFFALGGHSLLAVRLAARLQDQTGTTLPIRTIFETPQIAELAERIDALAETGAADTGPPLVPVDRTGPLPLSYSQERLWFVERFGGQQGANAEVLAFALSGAVDAARMGRVFAALYHRHEALRLRVAVEDGAPVQRFGDPGAVPFTILDLSGEAPVDRAAALARLAAEPVDPETGVFRACLVRQGPAPGGPDANTPDDPGHILFIGIHHLAHDGVSIQILLEEFVHLWTRDGAASGLPDLPVHYADFAVWQRRALESGRLAEGLARFEGVLANPPAALALPADRPRPEAPSHTGGLVDIALPAGLVAGLSRLATAEGASLFMVLESALAVLLARQAGTDDLVIGTVAAGRSHVALEGAVGPFFNMIALRHRLDGQTPFRTALADTRAQALAAFDDQLVPYEAVLTRVATDRSARLAFAPLFQVLFQLHTEAGDPPDNFAFGGITAEPWTPEAETQGSDAGGVAALHDLTFDLFEHNGPGGAAVSGRLTYSADLFDHGTAQRLVAQYLHLLEAIIADPDRAVADLELLSGIERRAVLEEFGTGPSLDRVVVLPARFAGLCRSFPCRVAVSECLADGVSGRSLSWGALEADARRLAVRLVATGVVPGTVVGVALGGVDLIVGLLGVWKAGGVYLPVDPEHPDERLGFVLGDAGAGLVVTAGPAAAGLAARLEGLGTEVLRLDDPVVAPAVGAEPAMDPAMDPGVATTAESAAYVIYTSGSTGRPKGVVVTHGQLAAFASAVVSDLDLDTGGQGDAVVLSAASPLFDAVFMDLSVWLGTGARLVRLDARSLAQPGYLADAVASHGASYMDLTPSVWRSALASGWTPGAGMRVVTGGEALEPDLAAALTAGGARLYNSYGPTEATVVAVAGDVGPVSEGGAIAIGGPLAGTRAYVLDSRLAPVPIGVPGELVLGGAQVARGYLGRPGLTAASFIADPFSGVPGARMYRTGDLVRWRTDGQLEFLGRIDGQVKIRGMRIEPGEIEATLAALDGVAQAAVTAPKDADGQARLVAYVVPAAVAPDERDAPGAPRTVPLEGDLAPTALRAALGRVLPEHMVPQAYLGLARMPLTPTGKTDRKALPEAGAETARAAFAPPETETETRIAAAIEELLGLEQVGRHDSFFALGGHSLLAVRLAARLQDQTGTTLPIRTIFETPQIAELAERIDALAETGAADTGPPLVPVDRTGPLPLSYSQERLWFVERFGGQQGANAEVLAFALSGAVDAARMGRVFAALYHRHEALRLRVAVEDGAPVQRFGDPGAVPFTILDLSGEAPVDRAAALARLAAEPVDPETGVFRACLVRQGPAPGGPDANTPDDPGHILFIGIHHLAHDGVSIQILLEEFVHLWTRDGAASGLPDLPVHYADFAVWQRRALESGRLAEGLARFEGVLANPPAALALPADRPRPEAPSHTGGLVDIALPAGLVAGLSRLATAEGASLFMVLESALAVLLARQAGTDDLVIGTVAAGRSHVALEGAVGPFFNMIALRHRLDGQTPFRTALADTRAQALAAFDDQLVPYEAVLTRVATDRSARLAFAPLFQVLFQLHTEAGDPPDNFAFGGITAEPWTPEAETQGSDAGGVAALHDLTFDLFEHNGPGGAAVSGRLTYSADLFDHGTAQRLVAQYLHLLEAIIADPDRAVADLELLSGIERRAVLEEFGTGPSLDRVVVLPARFAGLCRSFPCRVAVSECLADGVSGRSLSWGALEADARRLAVRLVATGVVPGTVVGVALGGVDLIVGLLGVWKAGGVYLPVDPEHPDERLGFVLGDAGAGLVVTAGPAAAGLAARLEGLGTEVLRLDDPVVAPAVGAEPAMDPAMDPGVATTAESAAYVIYTSGSTGRPKGVVVTHGQLAAFASAVVSDLDLDTGGQGDAVVLSAASPLFDAVFMDLSVWLGTGARLVRLDARSLAQPGYLADAVASHGASYMDLTPSVWRSALASGWTPGAGMRVVTGGEALEPDLAAALTAGGARLYNSYGPTEATVVAVAGDVGPVSEGGAIAIGGPLAGTRAYVLDSRLAPVPIGVPGELVLGGAQVARGYLGRPGLTAASFIADPFSGVPGARMYRTGDLVRWRTDGQLEFLGRIDGQVKIRGMRIEPGEIEATLAALDGVAQAAVTAPKDADGQARLVAYVVPAAVAPDERDAPGAPRTVPLEGDLAPTALRAALGRVLPEHMVPQAYLGLARMPLTPTGKTDRKALPEAGAETARAAFAPPETETETRIAAAIEELLGLEQVGRHDSFFALGGHSLLAVRLAARLQDQTGTTLPIRTIFETPQIAELAERIDALAETGAADTGPPLVPVDRTGPLPLSYSQERLWFVERFGGQQGANAEVLAFALSGAVDAARMGRVFAALYHRHEALRLRVAVEDGAPVQRFGDPGAVPFTILDLSGEAPVDRAAALARLAAEPVDPETGVFRACLVRQGPAPGGPDANTPDDPGHILFIGIHHLAHDGVSIQILLEEFVHLWTRDGAASGLPDLPVHYADFAVWQRRALESGRLAEGLARFEGVLANPPAALALPADRPRPEAPSHTGGLVDIALPAGLVAGLSRLATAEGASLFMVLESALAVLLARQAGTDDLVIGTVAAGRSHVALEGAVGPFFNMIALRHRLDGQTPFRTALADTRAQALAAFDDQLVPYEAVLTRVATDRSARLAFAPLFQVLFQLHTEAGDPPDNFAFGGITAEPWTPEAETQGSDAGGVAALHDLTFDLFEHNGPGGAAVSGRLTYSADLFDHGTAQRLVAQYLHLLEAIIADPDRAVADLELLSGIERRAVLEEFGTGPSLDRVVVLPARFAGLCRSFPCRVAVSECLADGVSGRSLSWGALEADARRLAVRLVATGVVPGTVVGVALGGVDLIVGLLGVWKAGGVYLPVDPEHPDERLGFVLGDAGAGLVVTAGPAAAGLAARLEGLGTEVLRLDDPVVAPAVGAEPAMDPAMDPGVATTAESAAYVIYTSGSTGRPKGVVVTHGQLAAFASAVVSDLDLDTGGQGDAVVLSAASPLFDAVFMDLSVWLGTGARLVRLDARSLAQPGYLADAVASHGASYMDLTPSVWRSALASGWTPGAGMRVVTGGEALEPDLAAALTAGGARLYNSYGPTEATVVAVAGDVGPVSEGGAIAIGGPLAGTRAYVLDSRLAPVPIGVPGELVLGGAQVARGYLGRPGLTAASFIADPFSGVPGARMYRTGDLVRWRTDGQLEFLGRIDGQVKIRGMRIEPGEIEATLAALDGVAQAAVTAPKDADGQARLVAYVVPAAVAPDERDAPGAPRTVPLEGDLAPTALRAALGRVLPEHMVPQAYLGLARMPLTPTGKTDRKALPEAGAETARAAFAPPETETETRIAAAIEELLGLEQVGRHDSFFALGGHSLLAVRLAARLQDQTGTTLPIRTIFETPQIAELAKQLDNGTQPYRPLIKLADGPRGSDRGYTLVCFPPVSGSAAPFAKPGVLDGLNPFGQLVAIQARGFEDGEDPFVSYGEMIQTYRAAIDTLDQGRPLVFIGWSMGGLVAHDIAVSLEQEHRAVRGLVLLDSTEWGSIPQKDRAMAPPSFEAFLEIVDEGGSETRTARLRSVLRKVVPETSEVQDATLLDPANCERFLRVLHGNILRLNERKPAGRYSGPALVIRAKDTAQEEGGRDLGWGPYCGALSTEDVPFTHYGLLNEDAVPHVIGTAARWLDGVLRRPDDGNKPTGVQK